MKIPIKNRKKEIISYAEVDPENYKKLSKLSWSLQVSGYPQHSFSLGNGKYLTRTMHQIVLDIPKGYRGKKEIDHLNHNKLDNRKCNLHLGTSRENKLNRTIPASNNTHGHLNVKVHVKGKCWTVNVGGKYYGHFYNLDEAAKKAKEARKEYLSNIIGQ